MYHSDLEAYLAWSHEDESSISGIGTALSTRRPDGPYVKDDEILEFIRYILELGIAYVVVYNSEGEVVIPGTVGDVMNRLREIFNQDTSGCPSVENIWLRLTPLGNSKAEEIYEASK